MPEAGCISASLTSLTSQGVCRRGTIGGNQRRLVQSAADFREPTPRYLRFELCHGANAAPFLVRCGAQADQAMEGTR